MAETTPTLQGSGSQELQNRPGYLPGAILRPLGRILEAPERSLGPLHRLIGLLQVPPYLSWALLKPSRGHFEGSSGSRNMFFSWTMNRTIFGHDALSGEQMTAIFQSLIFVELGMHKGTLDFPRAPRRPKLPPGSPKMGLG